MNSNENFLILPLQGAVLNEDVNVFSDLYIINGNSDAKIDKISNLMNSDRETVKKMLMHMINSRSNDFLKSPVLVYKTKLKNINLFRDYVLIAYYLIAILNAVYFAYVYPKNKIDLVSYMFTKKDRLEEFRVDIRKKNNHVLICNDFCKNFMCYPLNFNYECYHELDWINKNNNKNTIKEVLDIIYKNDDLSKRFLRGFRFFQKAILTEKEATCFNNEIKSDEILLLHIVLECLLIKDTFAKNNSLKIRKYISRIITLNDYKSKDVFNLIRNMTTSRGQYVHEGKYYKESNDKLSRILYMSDEEIDNYMKNKDSINNIPNLDLFKIVVAKVLIDNTIEISKLSDNCYNETTWFDKVEKVIKDR
ncbi:hypothetical protein SAMN02745134_00948 [Clostridium acidisoli DSM 12555]|uniref:Uncharacterized protein n=1 Tax=Clostridium acidisoli DSM 12555 TaxID=1121291 RepID=A0A1W1X7P6_9CLOT|nr:HEPN domain-containing protein [Clostridium acidisoli]SMC19864.1 hypothetical protein SAMN02745134_00948 [Clostridium acidisoli DSM 12555]